MNQAQLERAVCRATGESRESDAFVTLAKNSEGVEASWEDGLIPKRKSYPVLASAASWEVLVIGLIALVGVNINNGDIRFGRRRDR